MRLVLDGPGPMHRVGGRAARRRRSRRSLSLEGVAVLARSRRASPHRRRPGPAAGRSWRQAARCAATKASQQHQAVLARLDAADGEDRDGAVQAEPPARRPRRAPRPTAAAEATEVHPVVDDRGVDSVARRQPVAATSGSPTSTTSGRDDRVVLAGDEPRAREVVVWWTVRTTAGTRPLVAEPDQRVPADAVLGVVDVASARPGPARRAGSRRRRRCSGATLSSTVSSGTSATGMNVAGTRIGRKKPDRPGFSRAKRRTSWPQVLERLRELERVDDPAARPGRVGEEGDAQRPVRHDLSVPGPGSRRRDQARPATMSPARRAAFAFVGCTMTPAARSVSSCRSSPCGSRSVPHDVGHHGKFAAGGRCGRARLADGRGERARRVVVRAVADHDVEEEDGRLRVGALLRGCGPRGAAGRSWGAGGRG